MKPFNLEAAKNGATVVTRDGRKARVVCFDVNNDEYPLVTLITGKSGEEFIDNHTGDGKYNPSSISACHLDLFMAPVKKECWINLYFDDIGQPKTLCFGSKRHADKDDERESATRTSCIHHTWEE